MNPVRVLGAAGIISAALSTIGGVTNTIVLIGVGSAVMLVANFYALAHGGKS